MGNMGSLFHNTHNTKCQDDLSDCNGHLNTCQTSLATCKGALDRCKEDLTHAENLNKVEQKSAEDLIKYVAENYDIDKQELDNYYFKQRRQHMNHQTHGGTRKRKRRKSRHSK
jgi:hypothetical protein